jgi:hypothetical protein
VHAARVGEHTRQRLDIALLGFFQNFRKVYIGEQVMHCSKVRLWQRCNGMACQMYTSPVAQGWTAPTCRRFTLAPVCPLVGDEGLQCTSLCCVSAVCTMRRCVLRLG